MKNERMRFSNEVRFLPWVGDKYASGKPWGGRVLILGEAHYADDRRNRRLTRDVITSQWNGKPYSYFTKLASMIDGKDEIDKHDFWHRVAFYNFVQDIVADKARVAPRKAMWKNAQDILPGVLEVLAPRFILVTGARLWSELPDWRYVDPIGFKGRRWEVCGGSTVKGGPFVATYTNHPSSFGAFGAPASWRPLVRSLLDHSFLAGQARTAT